MITTSILDVTLAYHTMCILVYIVKVFVKIFRNFNQTHAKGVAISFFTENDAPLAKSLVSIMEKSGQEPPEDLLAMRNVRGGRQQQKYRRKGEQLNNQRSGGRR